MTKDRLKKALATKKARKQEFAAQTIRIDNEWKIVRIDALNWQIRKNGKCPNNRENFYGTIIGAFYALPVKMLSEQAQEDVVRVRQAFESLCLTIEGAIPECIEHD
jgi:hypothetical protein